MPALMITERPDGYHVAWDGQEEPWAYATEDDALGAAFVETVHGFLVVWVGDGAQLCSACARAAFADPDDPLGDRVRSGAIGACVIQPQSGGEVCDTCLDYLPGGEPFCRCCGTGVDDASFRHPVFWRASGEELLCAHCLADMVVRGEARKTGLTAYEVILNGAPCAGGAYSAKG